MDSFENSNYTSYIRASYVKFVESGGARVAPVLIDQSDEYYSTIFRGTNGLLIPGGHVHFNDSGLTAFVKFYDSNFISICKTQGIKSDIF